MIVMCVLWFSLWRVYQWAKCHDRWLLSLEQRSSNQEEQLTELNARIRSTCHRLELDGRRRQQGSGWPSNGKEKNT
jgi:hypothetical protein